MAAGRGEVRHGALRRAVRGVRARVSRQLGCGGLAEVTLDFEPRHDPAAGYEFADAYARDIAAQQTDRERGGMTPEETGAQFYAAIVAATSRGARRVLAEAYGLPSPPVRVVLRHALLHPVDANERRFEEAGELAAHDALNRD